MFATPEADTTVERNPPAAGTLRRSPRYGRFLQPDPVGYGDGMNMYAYVKGDPVNLADPGGTLGECAGTLIASVCSGAANGLAKQLVQKSEMGGWSEGAQAAAVKAIADYLLGRSSLDGVSNALYRSQGSEALAASITSIGMAASANFNLGNGLPGTSIRSGGPDPEGYQTIGIGTVTFGPANATQQFDIGFWNSSVKVTTYTANFAQPNQAYARGLPLPFGSFLVDLSACSGCGVRSTVSVPVTLGINRTYTFNISPMISVLSVRATPNTPRNTDFRIKVR